MNENDIVVFGRWIGSAYVEYLAIVRDIDPTTINLRHALNGDAVFEFGVLPADQVIEGQNYWRETTPEDFTDDSPVSGQVVWVSYAREEANSEVSQGIVLSSLSAFGDLDLPLRVIFGHRTRTLLPRSLAGSCDSFWSVNQPAPVYCDDD